MSDIVQADYERLAALANQFGQQSEANQAMVEHIWRNYEALQDSGWEGMGADAFFVEMEQDVYPALNRLTDALREAKQATEKIIHIMQKAEGDAAAPFRGEQNMDNPPNQIKEGAEEKSWWGKYGEWVHGGLDVIGFI